MSPMMRELQEKRFQLAFEIGSISHTMLIGDWYAVELDATRAALVAKLAEFARLIEQIREREHFEGPCENPPIPIHQHQTH